MLWPPSLELLHEAASSCLFASEGQSPCYSVPSDSWFSSLLFLSVIGSCLGLGFALVSFWARAFTSTPVGTNGWQELSAYRRRWITSSLAEWRGCPRRAGGDFCSCSACSRTWAFWSISNTRISSCGR